MKPALHLAARKAVLAALAFSLAACAMQTPFEWDRAKQVRLGMTEAELRALMGRPNKIEIRDDAQMWVWSYTTPSKAIRSVSFELRNGVVTAIPYRDPVD